MGLILNILLTVLITPPLAHAEDNLDHGVILKGYDAVSYFTEKSPREGKKEFAYNYKGDKYLFASKANQEKFSSFPEKYIPAYGGWCATAMAKGEKVEIDPTNYEITDGRLFLFYKSVLWGNAKDTWMSNENSETIKADENWKKISQTK